MVEDVIFLLGEKLKKLLSLLLIFTLYTQSFSVDGQVTLFSPVYGETKGDFNCTDEDKTDCTFNYDGASDGQIAYEQILMFLIILKNFLLLSFV